MDLINNIDRLLGDELLQIIPPHAKLSIAASCFSLFAFEALACARKHFARLNQEDIEYDVVRT
jgi:hypothetical protein